MKLSVANQRLAEKNFKLLKDYPQHPHYIVTRTTLMFGLGTVKSFMKN